MLVAEPAIWIPLGSSREGSTSMGSPTGLPPPRLGWITIIPKMGPQYMRAVVAHNNPGNAIAAAEAARRNAQGG
jgi:hypothetical protein